VGILLGYAAPELAAWVSAHREAVLRAAEAVDAAYIAAVDELASRLPGGEGAWERARGSVLFYDSEREEHLARASKTVENVEGWQSRALDSHGKRSVVALLPVRSLNVANRWVHGFGSATGSGWTMTRTAPSPETPLELASYDIRRMGVDVSQQTGEDGGGGSTMPTDKKPVLDPIHELVLEALRLEGVRPLYRDPVRVLDFSPYMIGDILRRVGFSVRARAAVVNPPFPGVSTPPSFVRASQMKHVREALVGEGAIAPKNRNRSGAVQNWTFAPAAAVSQAEYAEAGAALAARAAALVANGTPLGDKLAADEWLRGARG
jgi:hypothetical protein